eukprot:1161710-Pelagomonas_calceolata.AAC.8
MHSTKLEKLPAVPCLEATIIHKKSMANITCPWAQTVDIRIATRMTWLALKPTLAMLSSSKKRLNSAMMGCSGFRTT